MSFSHDDFPWTAELEKQLVGREKEFEAYLIGEHSSENIEFLEAGKKCLKRLEQLNDSTDKVKARGEFMKEFSTLRATYVSEMAKKQVNLGQAGNRSDLKEDLMSAETDEDIEKHLRRAIEEISKLLIDDTLGRFLTKLKQASSTSLGSQSRGKDEAKRAEGLVVMGVKQQVQVEKKSSKQEQPQPKVLSERENAMRGSVIDKLGALLANYSRKAAPKEKASSLFGRAGQFLHSIANSEKLNSKRVDSLDWAIKTIEGGEDIKGVLATLVAANMNDTHQLARTNKSDFGKLHKDILQLFPDIVDAVVRKANSEELRADGAPEWKKDDVLRGLKGVKASGANVDADAAAAMQKLKAGSESEDDDAERSVSRNSRSR